MTISDFGGLKAAVQSWAARSDTPFVNRIPEFVCLAEQRIFFGAGEPLESAPVRTRDMETAADVAVTSGIGALPARFLQARRLYWEAAPRRALSYLPPRRFAIRSEAAEAGSPCLFTIEGNSLLVAPKGTGTAKLWYFRRFDPLTVDSDSNALLTGTPALYLYGSLVEAFGYIRNAERAGDALQRYVSASGGVGLSEQRGRVGGALLAPRLERAVP